MKNPLRKCHTAPGATASTVASSPAHLQWFIAVTDRLRGLNDAAAARPLAEYRWVAISPPADRAGARRFAAPGEYAALEKEWSCVFPADGGDPDRQGSCAPAPAARRQRLWGQSVATRWLSFLEMNPAALDSLWVLDQVNSAVDVFEPALPQELRAALAEPLLKRACDIVSVTLSAAGESIQWAAKDVDHPGFASVVTRCSRALNTAHQEQSLEVAAILLRFNTDGIHHRRLTLVNLQLMAGNHDIAVALVRRFGDGGCFDVILAEVLALYRLGCLDEARGRLLEPRAQAMCAQAYRQSDGTIRYLLDKPLQTLHCLFPPSIPPPRSAGALGVLTERWVHTPNALEWLRATLKIATLC